jgi:hypothetical protein
VAEIKAANGAYGKPSEATIAVESAGHGADVSARSGQKFRMQETQGSVQSVKGDEPSSISINVAPAPPPDEYPLIKAAVLAAQKELKAGAKQKFLTKYSLGQVIGTGHYARWVHWHVGFIWEAAWAPAQNSGTGRSQLVAVGCSQPPPQGGGTGGLVVGLHVLLVCLHVC